jgi:hypothetical protein
VGRQEGGCKRDWEWKAHDGMFYAMNIICYLLADKF